MSLVKYIGPYAAVTVPSAGGVTVEKGKSVEVTEVEAEALLMAADSWEAGDEATKELVPKFPTPISMINGFGGDFDNTQVYSSGVIVLEGGYEYLSVKASLGETPSLAPTYWQRLGIVSRVGMEAEVQATQAEAAGPNLAFGAGAGAAAKAKSESNTLYGAHAGEHITTGIENTATGFNALAGATTRSGQTAVGYNALSIASGGNNTAVGGSALASCEAGSDNTAAGGIALGSVTTGESNTAVGATAASRVTTGNGNVAVGANALEELTTDGRNIAIGYKAGAHAEGHANVFIGYEAGAAETGSNKLYVANNSVTPLIEGTMSEAAATQEIGFLGAAPVKRQKLAAAGSVTAAEIRAALINLGLAE